MSNERLSPQEYRERTNPKCRKCGLPGRQTFVQTSCRGNFQRKGVRIGGRFVGAVCQCAEPNIPAVEPLPETPRREQNVMRFLNEHLGSDGLCQGCYKAPCECLPDDCSVDPE